MVLDVDMSKRRISLGLKQCMANPWESFAEQYPGGHRARGRGPQHHRVRPVRRPARRHRRHGASQRPVVGQGRRRGDPRLQEGRPGQGQGPRRRHRQGAHLARHQAARQRSVREGGRRRQEGRRGHRHRGRHPGQRHRRHGAGRHPGLHPQVRAQPRPLRAASRPLRHRRQARRQDHQHRQGLAPRRAVGQGARARRGEEGDGRFRLVRLGRQPGRHPGAALSRAQKKDDDEDDE